jgi:uncharacterized protein YndB with AHSA1/START domain
MIVSSVPPVRKELVVAATAERAFEVFTAGIDRWWPRQHHIGSSPLKRAVIEPGVGGRWYSLAEDGTECLNGKVLLWDPPRRLVLAWQITSDWKYDPSFVTEVEVTFTAEGPKTTRVVLEHRDLHRYGLAEPDYRKAIDSPTGGWGFILQRYADTAAG